MSDEITQSGRREFLKQSANALAGAGAMLAGGVKVINADANRAMPEPGAIPAHRPLKLPGLHSYAERSVFAGETIHFRISSTVPYRLSICRLAGDVDDAASDVVLETIEESEPHEQPIHPGSYVDVDRGLPAEWELSAVTLECWVRPWRLTAWQGIITQHDFPNACGLGLFVDSEGRAAAYLGDGGECDPTRIFVGGKLNHRRWNHVAATWDGKQVVLWVNGRKTGVWDFAGTIRAGNGRLRLGAYGQDGVADRFLEGDLAIPTIYRRALSASDIKERIEARGLNVPTGKDVVACWPLAEEQGSVVAEVSAQQRHGRIINHGTWMVGGPSFNGDKIGRYDESYEPVKDSNRGHGLRFGSDDLYDCRWNVTHEFQLPEDSRSGVYVGRFDYEFEGTPCQYHVTFNVRRSPQHSPPPILVLLSSSTWTAYNATPFPVPTNGPRTVGTSGLPNSHSEAPAYSCYRDHHHHQPAYYFGMKVPWPAAGPDWRYLAPEMQYSHLMRGELFLHRWLDGVYGDHEGYDYDVVTDYDLHRDPAMLKRYKTLFINGHSEYWSAEAYHGVDEFLSAGGTVVGLSGNTMFWRASFSEDGGVMECRKFDSRIGGRGGATIGELYHSHDKKRGSLMRECGLPAWKCIGLECCGWTGATDGAYHTDLPEHFLFTQPEDANLVKSETFGHARDRAYPVALGHEWDVRLSTLSKMTRSVPEDAVLPEEPEGITTLARGIRQGGGTLDYFTADTSSIEGVCAEVIYWERPTGGRVFHAGSIAAGSVLSVDPKWQTIMRNVLHHFGVQLKA